MSVSPLDVFYRKLLLTKLFTKGWGNPEHIDRLVKFRKIISDRDSCYALVENNHPITILNSQKYSDCEIIEGRFRSPFAEHQPGLVRDQLKDAYFQMVLPLKWPDAYRPMAIHLAGTGDQFFWRRRTMLVKPLLKHGIGGIILENPFYGLRKPKDQIASSLHYVSDIFVMGGCLILECLVLFHYMEKLGLGPLGVTGVSMGGHMASLAASNWPKPITLVPCLSWTTASSVFTEGVMSESIDWRTLQMQYTGKTLFSDRLSKACKIVDDPFACSLSKTFAEYELQYEMDLKSELKSGYITPHEMVNRLKSSDCSEVKYKSSYVTRLKSLARLGPSWKVVKMKQGSHEAIWFMRGIMDECTHLKNFSVPVDTSIITVIAAKTDGYVPRRGVSGLDQIWPGVQINYLNCGHVEACLLYRKTFLEAIVNTFERAKTKYPPPK